MGADRAPVRRAVYAGTARGVAVDGARMGGGEHVGFGARAGAESARWSTRLAECAEGGSNWRSEMQEEIARRVELAVEAMRQEVMEEVMSVVVGIAGEEVRRLDDERTDESSREVDALADMWEMVKKVEGRVDEMECQIDDVSRAVSLAKKGADACVKRDEERKV